MGYPDRDPGVRPNQLGYVGVAWARKDPSSGSSCWTSHQTELQVAEKTLAGEQQLEDTSQVTSQLEV